MINKDLIIVVRGMTLGFRWVSITQDEMFLGYFVGHDETYLSLLVTTKLTQVFIKYDKHQVYGFKIVFILFYFILFYFIYICCIFMWYLPSYFLIVYEKQNFIISSKMFAPNMPDPFFADIVAVFLDNAWQTMIHRYLNLGHVFVSGTYRVRYFRIL